MIMAWKTVIEPLDESENQYRRPGGDMSKKLDNLSQLI